MRIWIGNLSYLQINFINFENKKVIIMKFGLLVFENTENIGDDIQSYAAIQFLPQIDYFIDRENMNTFQTQNNEPIAVIMNGWFMHNKWNFPPSEAIYPNLISMHITNNKVRYFDPVILEFLDGIGGDYLRTFSPVGARDTHTLSILNKKNIPAYFSGCLTLTLPKQKIIKNQRKYICLVDLNSDVEKKIIEHLKNMNIDIKILTMNRDRTKTNWAENYTDKKIEIEKLLTVYQNAECVITSRLHVSLPCLAMETPVLTIFNPLDERFSGLNEYLNIMSVEDFLNDSYSYDILNPSANKPNYLTARNILIDNCKEFVKNAEFLEAIPKPLPYNECQANDWHFNLTKQTLRHWNLFSSKLDKFNQLKL